jgi:hypothetical protein
MNWHQANFSSPQGEAPSEPASALGSHGISPSRNVSDAREVESIAGPREPTSDVTTN